MQWGLQIAKGYRVAEALPAATEPLPLEVVSSLLVPAKCSQATGSLFIHYDTGNACALVYFSISTRAEYCTRTVPPLQPDR